MIIQDVARLEMTYIDRDSAWLISCQSSDMHDFLPSASHPNGNLSGLVTQDG